MREGWRRVALGEIATRRKDFTPVDAATMYRIVGVQRSGWGLVDRDPARGDSMKFDKLMRLNAKDLVYRTITAFEAPSTVVDESFAGAFVTPNTFPVYVLNQSQVLPGYMALLTTDPRFHEAMASRTVGSVLRRKTLSQKAFESIPIDLPPLAEQRRIVDLIAAVDDAIEAAEEEAERSGELRDAILDGYLPGSTVVIGDVASVSSGASWTKADVVDGAGEEVTPVLTIANTKSGGEIAGDFTYVRGLPATTKLIGDSSLVAIRTNGNRDRIGNVYRTADAEVGAAVSAFQFIIDPAIPADRDFLYWQMRTPRFQRAMTAAASGSTGLGNVAAAKLKATEISWPSSVEARGAATEQFESVQDARDAVGVEAGSLRDLRSNLLTALLSGEHEIPESYDRFIEEAA